MLEYEKSLTEASGEGDNQNLAASAGSPPTLWRTELLFFRSPHVFLMNRAPSVFVLRSIVFATACGLAAWNGWGATRKQVRPAAHKTALHKTVPLAVPIVKVALPVKTVVLKPVRKAPVFLPAVIPGGPWTQPTYADSTVGDRIDGEDLTVRRAAAELSWEGINGSVVAVDPMTGRVLAIVNQKVVTTAAASNRARPLKCR